MQPPWSVSRSPPIWARQRCGYPKELCCATFNPLQSCGYPEVSRGIPRIRSHILHSLLLFNSRWRVEEWRKTRAGKNKKLKKCWKKGGMVDWRVRGWGWLVVTGNGRPWNPDATMITITTIITTKATTTQGNDHQYQHHFIRDEGSSHHGQTDRG